MRSSWTMKLLDAVMLSAVLASPARTQQPAAEKASGDWPMYRHDFAGTGYSPLTQINSRNVATLTRTWTYSLQGVAPAPGGAPGRGGAAAGPNSQVTPIVVDVVMYLATQNTIVALDPDSGKEVW